VTSFLPDILAFLIAAAGWFYLFNAHNAGRLVVIEDVRMNHRRIALRKAGGGTLFALAIVFYCGLHLADPVHHALLFVCLWLGVFLLVGCIMILALVDLRMTRRMRADKFHKPS
jgi:hypothetical protein